VHVNLADKFADKIVALLTWAFRSISLAMLTFFFFFFGLTAYGIKSGCCSEPGLTVEQQQGLANALV
jgi:hypothetical protein